MTDQERNQVLKMIESGRITPEEGLHLMETLDRSPAEEEGVSEPKETGPQSRTEAGSETDLNKSHMEEAGFETDPHISQVKSTARRLWQIPLWIGVTVTVASATGMYAVLHGPGMNFWFFFLALPLLLGVAIVAAAVSTRKAHWIFVNIQQKPGEKPAHIFLGFPLPLKLAAWFLGHFGNRIPDLKGTNLDAAIQVMQTGFKGDSPLIVHVDDEDGERVQVFIG